MKAGSNLFKASLGISGLIALCALTFVLAQTEEVTVSTSVNTYDDQDYQEVFSSGADGILYLNWQEPLGTATSASTAIFWFLGAYKFQNGAMTIDLDRRNNSLSNNLYYAIGYSLNSEGRAGASRSAVPAPALFLSLLDTNYCNILVQSEDLLSSTNVAHFVFISDGDTENSATNYVILALIPLKSYPSAAVIQLTSGNVGAPPLSGIAASATTGADARSEDEMDGFIIHDSLLFEDTGFNLSSLEGQEGTGTTNSPYGGSLSNLYNWVTGNGTNGSSTNIPGGPPPPPPPDPPGGDEEDQKGKIFVDQARGNDSYSGRLPHVAAGNKGPKLSIRGGLAIAEPGDMMIIKSGSYKEDLNISGVNGLKVKIEGKVKL